MLWELNDLDMYIECLVKRHTDSMTWVLKILIVLVSIVLGIALFVLFLATRFLSVFSAFALALCIWGGWMVWRQFQLEFDYILTNFDLDVDKVIAHKKRKHLLTIDLHNIEQFARFDEVHGRNVESAGVRKRLDASSHVNAETWYLIFNSKVYGKTLLLFSPDERMQNAVKAANPQAAL